MLDSFQNSKSPGDTGMLTEFYKFCWELIGDSFIESTKETFKYGEMPSSQRRAVITLIEEQGKDWTLIENWQPISLINVDAKIISKVITVKVKMLCQALFVTIKQAMFTIVTLERQLGRFWI